MGSWTIYDKTGVAKAVVKELELHDEWMAECFITATINSATPIQFAVGDYIDYRNERYTIEYDPNVIKRATSGTYGEGFVYDGIKFLGSQDEIVRCDFNDLVLDPDSPSNKAHYTTLPTFPFYCESVDDLLDRIQANLEELYPNEWIVIGLNTVRNSQRGSAVGRQTAFENAYKQWVDPDMTPNTEPYGKQSVAESADNITCWDALTKVHNDFGLNFIVRGKVVVVGTAGVFTSNTFHYGKGNGLTEIERIGDTSQQIITRLRAYGSETNLPLHYYSTLNKRVYATVTNIKNKFGTQGVEFLLDLDFDDKYFTNQSKSYPKSGNYANYIVTLSANDCSVRGYVTKDYNSKACYVYCEYTGGLDDRDEPNATAMAAFVNALAVNDRVDFIDYIKKDSFGDGHYDYATSGLPDNMSVSRLMLPMFPNTSLYDWVKERRDEGADYDDTTGRTTYHGVTAYFSKDAQRPYIDSINKDKYGIRPASIYFDGSNETTDIHPTLEGMEYNSHRVDEIVSADQIEDNGVYDDSTIDVPNFNIILPDLGFELDKVYDQNASIDMKDGMCGGRSFKLASVPVKDSNGHWVCECERSKDENLNLFFPYEDFQISANDHYVLTGIQMPDYYIEAAAIKLLDAALDALQKNEEPRFTYQPKIDKEFMQRQHDSAISQGDVSLHDTLKAGDVFAFADTDMGVDASIIIDVLTIKENGDNGIPTYEVTLRDEKQVSTIQKIQNKVDSAFSSAMNGAGGGSGLTPQQIQSLVRKEGNDRYLSKTDDDTAKGNISFEKNINVGGRETVNEIQSSEYTGDGLLDTGYRLWYEEGRAKLVIDDLVARGKFTVNELETRIWTYAGGNMVFSGAGSTLFFVEYLDGNENPLGYTYINQPWLLRGRALLAGGLAWSKRKAIQRELTEAEKAQVVKFRCYEYSDDGTMQTRNWWKPNDIAMCETLNKVREKAASDGSYSGSASNTVYKRRIAGIGSKEIPMLNDGRVYDYVDLWNIYDLAGNSCKYKGTDGQEHLITDSVKGYDSTYHDWPAAGDVIVQMGNPLDTDRQSAVTIEVQGDVHGFKVYDTISDYSMANKLWVEIGYDQTTGKAKANVYGDFRFGCRENEEAQGGSYIKYNRTTKQLDIKANVRFMSPTSPQQETTLDSFASAVVGDLSNLQSQIDGQIESWFYNYSPVHVDSEGVPDSNVPLNVAPYSDWNTDALKIAHLGDTFTNNETGYCWRFSRNATTNAFEWVIIEDSAVIKALQDAARAQDTADHKRRTFVLPVTIDGVTYNYPYPPYDVGDLWVNATYPTTGTKTYENEILKCVTSKASTGSFDIADWTKASKYTDDTKVNQFISELLNGASDTEVAMTNAFKAIRTAMNEGETTITGGLVLSNEILLRDTAATPKTWAGISGMYDSTAQGGGVAIWAGGAGGDWEAYYDSLTPSQKESAVINDTYAKSLFRMDGTGYLASGKISWDGDGDGFVAGGNVAWSTNNQGVTTVTINGATVQNSPSINTQQLLLNGTDITSTLNAILSMFTLEGEGTQLSPYVIKANYSLYSEGDISALGNSTSGGGGGGASVLYELNDVTPNSAGNEVMGIVITDGQTTAGDGYVLTFDGSTKKWKAAPTTETYVLPQATSGALGGIKIGFTEANKNYAVQLDNAGKAYVNVPWTDTTYDLSGYLQKSGGTMTGNISVNADKGISIGSASARVYYQYVYRILGVQSISNSTDGTNVLSLPSKAGTLAVTDDLSSYLPLTGGTLTGALTINPSNTSSFQDGIILNDNGGGASEALTIKWTSASYTTGVKLSADLASNYLIFHDGTAWRTIYHSGNNPFVIRGELADAYINGTTYSTLDNGTYLHAYSGASEAIIHFQRSNCSASGLDIRFKYPQDASNPLQYRKCIDSNRFASTDWVTLIDSLNIGSQSVNSATKDGDGNTISSTYLKLIGGTLTGNVTVNPANTNDARIGVTNTNASGTSIFLLASTNRGVYHSTAGWLVATNGTDSWLNIGKVGIGTDSPSQKLHVSGGLLAITNNSRTVTIGAQNNLAIHIYNDNNSTTYVNGGFSSNANGSYDLGTSSDYWNVGYFNRIIAKSTTDAAAGTANHVALITGDPAGQHLEFDGNEIMSKASGTTNSILYLNAEGGNVVICEGAGNVGVGVTNPSYKLHVSGDIYATGGVTCASDIRLKDVLSYQLPLTVEQVAQAPTIKFLWKNKREEGEQVGSVAQYWQKVLPQSVSDKSDELGLSYGVAALISAITTARKVVDHEQRITELEKECERLRTENEQLKLRIA